MADRYTGLPPALKQAVYDRDNFRCRWCGSTNAYGYDVHHIEYRRGYSYDVIDNLITLCRGCHSYVHDSYAIPKSLAQTVLHKLVDSAGSTGMALYRALTKSAAAQANAIRAQQALQPATVKRVGRMVALE